MGYKFNGVEYDLTEEQGTAMVNMYKAAPFSMTDTVISGVLAQFKKTVAAVVKKSAETVFADVRAKVLADETVKGTMPKLVKAWERADMAKKAADELESIVLVRAKDIAAEAGLLGDGVRLGFNDGKLVLDPARKSHGGSAPGTTRTNGACTITFLNDKLGVPPGTIVKGENKQDAGSQVWDLIKDKWAGMKPSPYQGVMKYNKFLDAVIAQDGLIKFERTEQEAVAA